jgi:molybdopterin converting factor small subunit
MHVTVRAVARLRTALGTGEETVALALGATVTSLLETVSAERSAGLWLPGMQRDGSIAAQSVRVLVNGRDTFLLDGGDTVLQDGDVVSLIPIAAGGA